jgi:NAD dependent epimerase/dehydratase family enzyme
MANEMLLTGARVLPKHAEKEGFEFAHPQLDEALKHAIGRK